MDINLNELKTMKVKQLRKVIRESIKEVLKENANVLVTTKAGTKSISYKNPAELNTLKQDTNVSSMETTGGQKIKEMARTSSGYTLVNPEIDSEPFVNKKVTTQNIDADGRKIKVSLADIIEYFRANPDATKGNIFTEFNFIRPQVANAIVSELIAAGVLAKTSVGGVAVEPSTSIPGEPGEEENDIEADAEPEDLFIGGHSNPLSAYFDGEPNADGSEDFEPETTDEPATIEPTSTADEPAANNSSMSDEDYDAFMKYTDLKQRLDAVKGNLIKIKRSKGAKAVGDISDEPSGDIERLATLKKSLEDKVNALIAGSEYLQKRTSKASEKTLDEYEVNKLQYYAGIRK